jgi:hypothetical protein
LGLKVQLYTFFNISAIQRWVVNATTLGWPIGSRYTHYAVLVHKTYAVHTLNICHEYDPVDEIMGLAKPFTEMS